MSLHVYWSFAFKLLESEKSFLVKIGGSTREVKWLVKVMAIGVETGKF